MIQRQNASDKTAACEPVRGNDEAYRATAAISPYYLGILLTKELCFDPQYLVYSITCGTQSRVYGALFVRMAGHSQFKNIMYRKGAQDKKRASLFAKLGRELTVAARSAGPDPDGNPRLRAAIATARAANMPKDNLTRAIKRGSGNDADANYEEIRYEGYGKGGVAIIVETLTENRNRTASEIRSAFSRHGGTMAETGAVAFMFEHVGEVRYAIDATGAEAMFEAALDAGADDVQSDESGHTVTCRHNRTS